MSLIIQMGFLQPPDQNIQLGELVVFGLFSGKKAKNGYNVLCKMKSPSLVRVMGLFAFIC